MEFREKIIDLIESKREGVYWDFKSKPHSNKAALLHDILCLANVIYSGSRYIIIGVSDPSTGCNLVGLTEAQEHRKSQTDLIDFIRSKKFSGDFRPNLELKTIHIEDCEIDVIIIFDNSNKPFYLSEDYRDNQKLVRANYVYSRTNDSNTPIDSSADFHIVESLWRQRFGLDLRPLERMKLLLQNPDDWFLDLGNKGYCYHKLYPEFNIHFSSPESIIEPFGFYYPNESSFLGDAVLKYHSTILYEAKYMHCDEMRIDLVYPKLATVGHVERGWFYYFDLSTLEGRLLHLLQRGNLDFSSRCAEAPFLVFDNNDDFIDFQMFIKSHRETIDSIDPGHASLEASKRKEKDGRCSYGADPIFLGKMEQLYNLWKG